MQALLLAFTSVYWRLSALIWADFAVGSPSRGRRSGPLYVPEASGLTTQRGFNGSADERIFQPGGLPRSASARLHPDGRRLQHALRDTGLSRRGRAMEARPAGDLPGLHGRGKDAPPLLGAQPHRLAAHWSGW